MALGNQQSWKLTLHFDHPKLGVMSIEPNKCGKISINKQGMLKAVDGQYEYEVPDQVFKQTSIPLSVAIRNAGENDQEEYLEAVVKSAGTFDVVASFEDIEGNPQREYTLSNCKLSGGDTNDYDNASKSINMAEFSLSPRKSERTFPR